MFQINKKMFGKNYYSFLEKISILKNNATSVQLNVLETEEQEFVTECSRHYGENIDTILSKYDFKLNSMAKSFNKTVQEQYNKINIAGNVNIENCKKCESQMITFQGRLICQTCGFNVVMQTTFYGDNSRKNVKKDTAETYFQEWMQILQARSMFSLPDIFMDKLKEKATKFCDSDLAKIDKIKCSVIRTWLSDIGASKYNKYVPCIYRKLTKLLGRELTPPQFSISDEQIIHEDWKALVNVYGQKYNDNKSKTAKKKNNNAYYPILIYFIVRKRFGTIIGDKFKEFIHTQSNETFKARLNAWEETCIETKHYL